MENKYSINIHWSEEQGEFIALCEEFPHLSGISDIKEKAFKILQEDIEDIIEWSKEDKEPLPEYTPLEKFRDG